MLLPIAVVSHDLCMGTLMCRRAAPRGFHLNADGQAEYQGEGSATLAELREAVDSCPMGAISLVEPERPDQTTG